MKRSVIATTHPCWLCGGKRAQLRQLPEDTVIHLCDRCLRIFQDAILLDRTADPLR